MMHARLLQSRLQRSTSRSPFSPVALRRIMFFLSWSVLGCQCSSLDGEHEGQHYTRCAQVDPPAARDSQIGPLKLQVNERVLTITAARPLRIAAFTGPVGALLDPHDLALLRAATPGLVVYLGGLGDTVAVAQKNLSSVAALRVPTLFVAGGDDRWPVVESAFAALGEIERDHVLSASGLREVRLGDDRFVVVAGAAFGRYALDEQGCGFGTADLADIESATRDAAGAKRTWLLSWEAPAGQGVSEGRAGSELGSPDVQALATALLAKGGLFAYPEVQAGRARTSSLGSSVAGPTRTFDLVLPRLGRLGSQRADGSRLPPQVATVVLSADGLVTAPVSALAP